MNKKKEYVCTPIEKVIDNKIQKNISIDFLYKVIAYLLGVVFFSIFCILLFQFTLDKFITLLAPLGIILSASIASLSVLKSINNTKKIELRKRKEKEKSIKIRMKSYLLQLCTVINLFEKSYVDTYSEELIATKSYYNLISSLLVKDLIFLREAFINDTEIFSSKYSYDISHFIVLFNDFETLHKLGIENIGDKRISLKQGITTQDIHELLNEIIKKYNLKLSFGASAYNKCFINLKLVEEYEKLKKS
ncbi:hypothetical protein CRV03_08970 [Arcobacter sp. F155]|uniref:hypothetical protein n=1 Tax=Arcobacter sp. F155 TaxID=2044512 RepID=UPI00100A478A|nr:hypothetical protein [Arcobacter sp. F155]RXJ76575.1 hypothetical protein CRV03_08970 [Arcobacter sp. F155]